MDMGARFEIVFAKYLSTTIIEPPWSNYFKELGPKISYNVEVKLKKMERYLLGELKSALKKIVRSLPNKVLKEEGPTGSKVKRNWSGDEV